MTCTFYCWRLAKIQDEFGEPNLSSAAVVVNEKELGEWCLE